MHILAKDRYRGLKFQVVSRDVGGKRRELSICPVVPGNKPINSLSSFFAVIESTLTAGRPYWFRGHSNSNYRLVPSALRWKKSEQRKQALALSVDFKRLAPLRLSAEELPEGNDELAWLALAQHYGLPTRLLDWTENAAVALFFAVSASSTNGGEVFLLDPILLNQNMGGVNGARVLDAIHEREKLIPYLSLNGQQGHGELNTLAINPIHGTRRIVAQGGCFTLHGEVKHELDVKQAPGLLRIVIPERYKEKLRQELQRIGVDHVALFPDAQNLSHALKIKAGLV